MTAEEVAKRLRLLADQVESGELQNAHWQEDLEHAEVFDHRQQRVVAITPTGNTVIRMHYRRKETNAESNV